MSPEAWPARRQADVRRAAHARRQLVELPAAPATTTRPSARSTTRRSTTSASASPARPTTQPEGFGLHRTYTRATARSTTTRGARRRRVPASRAATTGRASPRRATRCTTSTCWPDPAASARWRSATIRPTTGCATRGTTMPTDPRCPMTTKMGGTTMSTTIGIGVVGLRLDGPGPQPLLPAHPDAVPRSCGRARARGRAPTPWPQRRDDGRRRLRVRARPPTTGARSSTHPTSTSSSSPRPTCCTSRCRGRRRRRQGGLLREAGRRHAARRPSRAERRRAGRRHHRRRATTTAGRRWCSTPAAHRRRPARRDHQLPRPVLLDVRQRPAGAAVVAVPRRRGRLRRQRATSSATPSTSATSWSAPITEVVGAGETFITRAAAARPAAAPTTTAAGRGDPTGAVTNEDYVAAIVALRQRRDGHVRAVALDGRAGEPERLRGLRHQGLGRLEPRADERAAGVPSRRAPAHRASRRCSAATASPTTATSCREAPTASASRT